MKYAPILIPTLCRDKHFIRLIESLKKNSWAKYTDIYIGLDYPSSENHRNGYEKISNYLKGDFSEFASMNVIKHTKNIGSSANMKSLIDVAFSKFDCFIRTDDDAEFSPNFIEYMDKCLTAFEYDQNICAVSGYSHPIEWKTSLHATVLMQNFICPMWGVGFWKEKYHKAVTYFKEGRLAKDADIILKTHFSSMMRTSQCEYVNLCLSYGFKNSLAAVFTDISMNMYATIHNYSIITPVISKVRNWGFDGSGEYCLEEKHIGKKMTAYNYPYNKQKIDMQNHFDLVMDTLNAVDENRKIMNDFDVLPFKIRFKAYIKKILYQLFGRNIMFKICMMISGNK